MRRHLGGVVPAVLMVVVLVLAGHAEALSTADLADDWRVTFVASPTLTFGTTAVRTYQGDVTFSAVGVASGTLTLGDLAPGTVDFTVVGSAALSAQGLVPVRSRSPARTPVRWSSPRPACSATGTRSSVWPR